MNKKTSQMALFAMLLAIELVLLFTPLGYLRINVLNLTTMHIPVIICGIVLGKKYGAILGLVFGLTSVWNATMAPGATSFVFSPFITVGGISGNFSSLLIAIIPRVMIGFLAGLTYELLSKKLNDSISVGISAFVGALTNTILVLAGIYLFFGQAYADVLNVAYDVLIGVLLAVVTSNGIAEALLAVVISILVCKAIKPMIKTK